MNVSWARSRNGADLHVILTILQSKDYTQSVVDVKFVVYKQEVRVIRFELRVN